MTDIEISKKAGVYDIANANDTANERRVPVSYTHMTLPTSYDVYI